jgi:hypothetical protein
LNGPQLAFGNAKRFFAENSGPSPLSHLSTIDNLFLPPEWRLACGLSFVHVRQKRGEHWTFMLLRLSLIVVADAPDLPLLPILLTKHILDVYDRHLQR